MRRRFSRSMIPCSPSAIASRLDLAPVMRITSAICFSLTSTVGTMAIVDIIWRYTDEGLFKWSYGLERTRADRRAPVGERTDKRGSTDGRRLPPGR